PHPLRARPTMEQAKALNALEARTTLPNPPPQEPQPANTARPQNPALRPTLQIRKLPPRGRGPHNPGDLRAEHLRLRRAPRDAQRPSPGHGARGIQGLPHAPTDLRLGDLDGLPKYA